MSEIEQEMIHNLAATLALHTRAFKEVLDKLETIEAELHMIREKTDEL